MINVVDGMVKDYEDLIEFVIEKVKEYFGVIFEREVCILGESKQEVVVEKLLLCYGKGVKVYCQCRRMQVV